MFLDWLATLVHGKPRFDSPLLFAAGFLFLFGVGCLSRLAVAIFSLHGTAEVVAHLHYVLYGSSLFAILAGAALLVAEDLRPAARRAPRRRCRSGSSSPASTSPSSSSTCSAGSGCRAAPPTYTQGGHWESYNVDLDRGLRGDGRRDHRASRQRLPHHRAAERATTRGRRTRSSGTRPRRRPSRTSTPCRPSPAPGRCTTFDAASRSPVRTEPAPGPWLRLTAIGAAAAVLVAVVSGAAGLGTAHQMLAALALPPLVAVAVAALLEYRRLVVPAFVSLGLFGLAALLTAPGSPPRRGRGRARRDHGHRRAHVPRRACPERPLARLRDAHQAADHDAAPAHGRGRDVRRRGGSAAARPLRRDDDRPRARLRRRERAQPHARPGHRRADGEADGEAARRGRPRVGAARARVRARADGVLVHPARGHRQPADGDARPGRRPLLRARLHAHAEAEHLPEHRDRRRRRRGAPARRATPPRPATSR